jgi:hypothetical protein
VDGLAQLGGLPDKMLGAISGAGALILWSGDRGGAAFLADAQRRHRCRRDFPTARPRSARRRAVGALANGSIPRLAGHRRLIGTASLAYILSDTTRCSAWATAGVADVVQRAGDSHVAAGAAA